LETFLGHTVPPIISIVGASGAGKTTLLEKLIPDLIGRGFRVGTIKHDVHGFEIDRPGKDSWRHKQAGAAVTIISSPSKIGMVMDVNHDHKLDELAPLLSSVDIILTEGYKREDKAKLEIFRPEVHGDPLCMDDEHLVALVTDSSVDLGVPRFSTNDIRGLADFLIARFSLHQTSSARPREVLP
jgi:molybdopterin-guanine dinucleotide biosynthesis protein B